MVGFEGSLVSVLNVHLDIADIMFVSESVIADVLGVDCITFSDRNIEVMLSRPLEEDPSNWKVVYIGR